MTFLPQASAENLSATLRGDEPTESYLHWSGLRERLVPFIGERAVTLFSYAIAEAAGSAVCAEYFRGVLEATGEDPDDPQVTEAEQLLIDWGRLIATDPAGIGDDLTGRIEQTFNPQLRVLLVAFAAQVVAASVFAIVGRLGPIVPEPRD